MPQAYWIIPLEGGAGKSTTAFPAAAPRISAAALFITPAIPITVFRASPAIPAIARRAPGMGLSIRVGVEVAAHPGKPPGS